MNFLRLQRTFATYRALSSQAQANHGIYSRSIYRNLSPAQIYEVGIGRTPANPGTPSTVISSKGAYCAYSGEKTGRSPKDKRIVCDENTENEVWWGDVNIKLTPKDFGKLETRARDYINNRDRVYVVDGYIGDHVDFRRRVRVFCTRSYHALFMHNMMIRPTEEELKHDFDEVDFTIYNAGEFYASPDITGSRTCSAFDFTNAKAVILGSQYAGEMKKGLFTLMHYLMPMEKAVSLHASCNEGADGSTTILFGLSGTGKTTLSADPTRKLIGDDEHVWHDHGVFNIEGGCYAKVINLSATNEPEIWNAIQFGSVLENVKFSNKNTREVDFTDTSITENTRVAYPLHYIPGSKSPAAGGHPKNIIFLTCDAYGVLPPVTKLTSEQAMYHFISGYTAKVAGTEMGIKEPVATFSACFGEAFLPRHPAVYAELLAGKIDEHKADVWLINTGWVGGKYGVGNRISLKNTRAIIDAIHDGSLAKEEYERFPVFDLGLPKKINGVDQHIINPRNAWTDKNEYDELLKKLAGMFADNFKTYEDRSSATIINAGPKL